MEIVRSFELLALKKRYNDPECKGHVANQKAWSFDLQAMRSCMQDKIADQFAS